MSPAAKVAKAAKAAKSSKEDAAVKTEKAPKAAKPASKKVVDIKDAPKKGASHVFQPKSSSTCCSRRTSPRRPRWPCRTRIPIRSACVADSTKPEIKAAVELMFNVKVNGVQVVNETGKTRRFGKTMGRTQDIKKAYVRLAPGQTIDYEAKIKA